MSSPHARSGDRTAQVMLQVAAAAIPGVLALVVYFGIGVLINIALCTITALLCEAGVMKLRGRPVAFYLKDYSAFITALLLGIALPPYCAWWLPVVGSAAAIILSKQLYGGIGYNPFNPAMVGYVVLLISFPVAMTTWTSPRALVAGDFPGLGDSLAALLLGRDAVAAFAIDGISMATPLDVLKQNNTLLISDLWAQSPQFGQWGGLGWEWANLGFLAGGLWLLYRRVFTWHAPVSMLVTLTLMAALFYDKGSSGSGGSPLFHLLSGATMFGAFFIVTDPVTSAVSNLGRAIYGACIGILLYIIRVWGNYPDAIAFAVLLMNFTAPLLDYYTQPRTYGHRGRENRERDR